MRSAFVTRSCWRRCSSHELDDERLEESVALGDVFEDPHA